jgi:uncharacterized membrane protein YgaE (UPF0421/DUF939 family)
MAFVFWKALDFLIYTLLCTGVVWLLWGDVLNKYTFLTFLGAGYLRFWEYGVGFGFLGVIVTIIVSFLCLWLNGRWDLKAKQAAVGRDVEKRSAALAASMRAAMEAEIAKSNEDAKIRLQQWQSRLAIEEREFRKREQKVDDYRKELKAIRELHKRYACNHEIIRQRGYRALEVLEREEPCIGEAKRLVRKIIKLA